MWIRSRILCWILLITCFVVQSAALHPFSICIASRQLSSGIHVGTMQKWRDRASEKENPVMIVSALSRKKIQNVNSLATPTNVIIAVNVLLFALAAKFPQLKQQWMKIDQRIARGETYRLLTSMFMHGGLSHLAMNCYSLYNIGPQANRIFGTPRYFAIYVGAGMLANAFTFLGGQSPYSLGASGSIFGVMGAIGAYYWVNRKVLGNRSDSALKSIQRNIVMNVLYGMSSINVDQWAHLGGLGAGAALALCLAPRLDQSRSRRSGASRFMRIFPTAQRQNRWADLRDTLQRATGIRGIANSGQEGVWDTESGTMRYGAYTDTTTRNLGNNSYSEYGELSDT